MAIIRSALIITALGAPQFASGLHQHSLPHSRVASASESSCAHASGRHRTVVFQRPPKGSKFLQTDDEEAYAWTEESKAFREFKDYTPAKTHGTMKPGTTPENAPLSEILKLPVPHKAPGFQEVPFHIRWPAGKPSSMPLLQWIDELGMLMTDEEEEEVEKRSRTAAAERRKPAGSPRMVSPEDIDDELMGLGDTAGDEKLLAEALGVGTALKPEGEGKTKEKKSWTAPKTSAKAKKKKAAEDDLFDGDSAGTSSDEELLAAALGGMDFE